MIHQYVFRSLLSLPHNTQHTTHNSSATNTALHQLRTKVQFTIATQILQHAFHILHTIPRHSLQLLIPHSTPHSRSSPSPHSQHPPRRSDHSRGQKRRPRQDGRVPQQKALERVEREGLQRVELAAQRGSKDGQQQIQEVRCRVAVEFPLEHAQDT